jgi:hypothetical protein
MATDSKFRRIIRRLLKTPPQSPSKLQQARTEKDLSYIAKGINPGPSEVDRVMAGKRKKPAG